MERRREAGRPLDRHSVASFFVSRVDTEVDKRLEAAGRTDLAGRAGLANARAAYLAFRSVFDGERFAALREAGCPVQRPLWASTGVKNPAYPETMYVYGLVAPRLRQHDAAADADRRRARGRGDRRDGGRGPDGRPRGAARGRHRPRRRHRQAAARRHRRLRGADEQAARRDREQARGDRHRPPRRDRGRPAGRARAGRRRAGCAARRTTTSCTASGTATARCGRRRARPRSPTGSAGSTSTRRCSTASTTSRASPREVRGAGYTDVVLCGMGGSSLAPEVFRRSWPDHRMTLHVLDSTHPGRRRRRRSTRSTSRRRCSSSPPSRAGRSRRCRSSSSSTSSRATARTTSPSPTRAAALAELGREHGFRRVFENDPDIGGRYSALSYFGLVPAALIGVDIRAVLEAAEVAAANCQLKEGNSGLWLGIALGELARNGRDKLTFVVDEPLSVVRPLGRAARRRVDRQARPRHPADRRRAAGAIRTPTGRTACSCTSRSATRTTRRKVAALRKAGPPDDHRPRRRARPTSGGCSSTPSSPPRSPAGCWSSTRSTSRTCRRPRTTRPRRSPEGPQDLDPGEPRRAARTGSRRRATWRSSPSCPYSEETDAAVGALRASS